MTISNLKSQISDHQSQQRRARKIHYVINCKAGAAAGLQRNALQQALDDCRYKYEVEGVINVCEHPKRLIEIVRNALASGADVIAAGGGDGTISTVADMLVGTPVALGILPFGTLNHFAKDLGIPLDPHEAVEVICKGVIKEVDIGKVNGRHFINNSSLGIYPESVRIRERWRPLVGKWVAYLIGALMVLRRFPVLKLNLEFDGTRVRRYAPLLFIGNNNYAVAWPELGARARLDENSLSVWIVRDATRLRLFRSILWLVRGELSLAPEIETYSAQSLTVKSRRYRIRVAVDGEVLKLRPPLRFHILPKALKVCVPAS